MKMFFGVFVTMSLIMMLSQFVSINVADQPDLASKAFVFVERVNWLLVFGLAFTAAALVAGVSLLKHTPIGKALDSRDE